MKSDFVGIGEADLISSAKQISSEQSEDFIALCAISLKNEQSCSIIQLDKLEFIEQSSYATFAYCYLISAPFGYSLAKNTHSFECVFFYPSRKA